MGEAAAAACPPPPLACVCLAPAPAAAAWLLFSQAQPYPCFISFMVCSVYIVVSI